MFTSTTAWQARGLKEQQKNKTDPSPKLRSGAQRLHCVPCSPWRAISGQNEGRYSTSEGLQAGVCGSRYTTPLKPKLVTLALTWSKGKICSRPTQPLGPSLTTHPARIRNTAHRHTLKNDRRLDLETWPPFRSQFENDKFLPERCTSVRVKCYRGTYNDIDDLQHYLAILHIPYTWSSFDLFQAWRVGLIYVIPSLPLLLSMDRFFWTPPFDKTLLNESEWYSPENRELFIYFDSWTELPKVYDELRNGLREKLNKRIRVAAEDRCKKSIEKWTNLIHKL